MRKKDGFGVRFKMPAICSGFLMLLAIIWCSSNQSTALMLESEMTPSASFDFRCFDDEGPAATASTSASYSTVQFPIGLQVSHRVTHQLLTRIFAIFLREKLKYHNISLIPLHNKLNASARDPEWERLKRNFELFRYFPTQPDITMINLEFWMPSVCHTLKPDNVYEAGPSITTGRFGWFVPEMQTQRLQQQFSNLYYSLFLDPNSENYQRFIIDEPLLRNLKQKSTQLYISPNCEGRVCVTLLAQHWDDTAFVERQINDTGAYVNILWLGVHFKQSVREMLELYSSHAGYHNRAFILLHWTPSDIIDGEISYQQIKMPQCEEQQALQDSFCKYELTPLLKYYWKNPVTDNGRLLFALRKFYLKDTLLRELLLDVNQTHQLQLVGNGELYNKIACNWLKKHTALYEGWIMREPIKLSIGGIFPITETSRGHQHLVHAVRRAVAAINNNATVLANYQLEHLANDGQCKADLVMKAFIHYFNVPNVMGVLGPACSETVEPIAGISRHMNMAVISYSAEGASFLDRQTYPYFFRTIGSNRQYEHAYISLMQHFRWRRVAALAEDGQKYTEYISHMEANMKHSNLELIINKKFLSDVTAIEMNKHLLDLKRRHAKIIIADIHSRNAELALCEAYKLRMTAYDGYIWFLPAWLSKDWHTRANNTTKDSCTHEQLQIAFEGHLSIMHAPFGNHKALMQENISIEDWLKSYAGHVGNNSISNYTGFAYDAVWAYALAADKLLRENGDAVHNLRSRSVARRFVELIWQTDFEGLSGRVRFGQGGSRITNLNIMQWQNADFVEVGNFYPQVVGEGSNLHTQKGNLVLHPQKLMWLSGSSPPGDGTYDCNFSGLAELLATDCDNAAVLFTALLCVLAVVIISLISFLFWKQRYDSKLKKSAKIMKNFGIDLLSPSRNMVNTLDKWEIAKERIVMNRRLGEGAFGTVYGGEAQLTSDTWTPVAVKSLKSGASTEDRLDFLSEAEAMKRFDHKNIIKLLAVCLQSEPIYTIMEFMLYGDLKTYLLARRHMVTEKIGDDSDVSSKRLTMFASDVASGLAYLAKHRYVHRDLACRNCLVSAERVVKIGDFGMARSTHKSDYYRFHRRGMLPVRWMAPESFADGLFTPASDVWAFGIVLYEIITFGSFPYQGMTNSQVLDFVKSGKTLQIPIGVKPHLEALMRACWSKDRQSRPTAIEIINHISKSKDPRLLTPCLDIPQASREMPETDSDLLDTLDILATANVGGLRNLEAPTANAEDSGLTEHTTGDVTTENIYVPPPILTENFSPVTPEGYSVMSPLLMYQANEHSDSSRTQLISESPPPADAIPTLQQQTAF